MRVLLRFLFAALLAIALAGCHASADGQGGTPDFRLQLYRVPVQDSQAIAKSLSAVLESSDYLAGVKSRTEMTVTQPFPGAVLVLAPATLQPWIGTAIRELAKTPMPKAAAPTAAEAVPLRVRFWMVQARAGAGEDAASLDALQAALKPVRGSLGPSHFELEDTAAVLVSASDQSDATTGNASITTSRGHMFQLHAETTASAGIKLRVDFANATADAASRTVPELKTTLALRPQEYVVLAEAPPAMSGKAADATLMNLLVVRVDRVESATH